MPYKGRVLTEWLNLPPRKPRKMMIHEDFSFVDSNGLEWSIPPGIIINGISFPEWRKNQSFWKNILYTVGSVPIKAMNLSPFVGNARRASVIHDHYCKIQSRSSEATHKMFHEAMIEDFTPKWQADLFYNMVRIFKKW